MNKVVLSQIAQSDLKKRFDAYLTLTGKEREQVSLSVSGNFLDRKDGELVFLNRLAQVDTSLMFRNHLTVRVDGEWLQIKADEFIDTVVIEEKENN